MVSLSSFPLRCLRFYIAHHAKPLLAFGTSWGRSRTTPETKELSDCGRWPEVNWRRTKHNTHWLSPSCIRTPQLPEKVPCEKYASVKILSEFLNCKTSNNSSNGEAQTNRCLDGVCLSGSSVRSQRHSCNRVWQFATRACLQGQPQLCPGTSDTRSLPPTGEKHMQ